MLGVNDRDKRKIIKSVIKSQKVDVVCLQETKIKEMTTGLVRSPGVGRHLEKRSRGGGLTASMRRFSEVVEDLELRDFPLMGGPFTWRGGLNIQA